VVLVGSFYFPKSLLQYSSRRHPYLLFSVLRLPLVGLFYFAKSLMRSSLRHRLETLPPSCVKGVKKNCASPIPYGSVICKLPAMRNLFEIRSIYDDLTRERCKIRKVECRLVFLHYAVKGISHKTNKPYTIIVITQVENWYVMRYFSISHFLSVRESYSYRVLLADCHSTPSAARSTTTAR
jgi:hypothetical protein